MLTKSTHDVDDVDDQAVEAHVVQLGGDLPSACVFLITG
jgi:hypothetical protein